MYIGKTFISTRSGSIIKEVNCEKCRLRYFYEMTRTGEGSASAPYMLGQEHAAGSAEDLAKKRLIKKLETESDMVACPKCGHVQPYMVGSVRSRAYWGLKLASIVVPVVGLLYVLAGYILKDDRKNPPVEGAPNWLLIAAVACVALFAVLSGVRQLLLSRGNWRTEAMKNAPPALLPQSEPYEPGETPLVPANSNQRVGAGA